MNEFNFSCDKCPRTFKLEEFYEKHKKVHELKKQHKCSVCGFVYGAAKGLEGHLKTHSEVEVAAAEILAKNVAATTTAETTAAVAASLKAPETPSPMEQLMKPFLSSQGVLGSANVPAEVSLEAQRSPPDNRGPPSPSGTGSYEVYDSIPHDIENGVQNRNGFFVCKICSREFSGLNSLRKHVPIHTRKVQHKCDICGHVFGKKEYLLDHTRKHTGEVSPTCEVCGQTFVKTLKLKEHFKIHRNADQNGVSDPNRPFKCHVCGIVFKYTSALGKHLTDNHPESFVKCDLCNATFGDIRGKNHHMQSEHQVDNFNQKRVWCPVCNQGFTRHYNLKIHMYKTHGKDYIENNFSTDEINNLTKPSIGSAASKPGHYFDPKMGNQVLSCQMCERKFIRKSDLYIHMDADHGVLLFGCSLCDDKFLDVVTLQNHVSATHPAQVKPAKRKPGPASKTNAPPENRFDGHLTPKNPNLSKRAALMRDALGLVEDGAPAEKRQCFNNSLINQDKHVKETDDMRPKLLEQKAEAARAVREANAVREAGAEQSPPPAVSVEPVSQTPEKQSDPDEDIRYEAVTEPFLFEGQIIYPCYVILPYVTDADVEAACNPRSQQYSITSDDEDVGRLTIDETAGDEEEEEAISSPASSKLEDLESPKKQKEVFLNPPISFLGMEPVPAAGLLQAAFASIYSDLSKRTAANYNAEDINVPNNPESGFYPKISDYSLPFTLTNMWKKKADILGPKAAQQLALMDKVEQMRKYNGTLVGGPDAIDRLSPPSPKPGPRSSKNKKKPVAQSTTPVLPSTPELEVDKKKSPKKGPPNDSLMIQGYEASIRNDNWPLQCIKCVLNVDSLEAFNEHMNDHWTVDKCCPVCGLLINSKRFNFKQHLKIHTGEKPFVCKICSRSFRQKAHMVKHISIHRSVPAEIKQELFGSELKPDQLMGHHGQKQSQIASH